MADQKRRKKGDLPPGVKGPNQPPAQQPPARPSSGQSRQSLERASIPILTKLMAIPRWLIVALMGAFLFLGLIQTGSLAWL